MQIEYESLDLDDFSLEEIKRLLSLPQENRSELEQMWFLIDTVWDEYDCDNSNPDDEKIGKFYSHPVWLLNGLFLEQHELSMQHRDAISDWITDAGFESIVDYGGGFGTLAKMTVEKNTKCHVAIYEPYPTDFALHMLKEYERITIVSDLDQYDCLISLDVLEHVVDPLKILFDMKKAVKDNGFLIIANNFNPFIKCHLPQTFHLKYSFNLISRKIGLKKIGNLKGSHATIYKKEKKTSMDLETVRKFERLSIACFPFMESIRFIKNSISRLPDEDITHKHH